MPFNREMVFNRLPKENTTEEAPDDDADKQRDIDNSFVALSRGMRYEATRNQRKKKHRLDVKPGCSESGADTGDSECDKTGDSGSEQESENMHNEENLDGIEDGRAIRESTDDSDDSDEEPLIEIKRRKVTAELNVGDYVLFTYDGEMFPGVITEKDEKWCQIKAMVRSGWNWKWPKDNDVLWYPAEEVSQKIEKPKELNRGTLEVKELKRNIAF